MPKDRSMTFYSIYQRKTQQPFAFEQSDGKLLIPSFTSRQDAVEFAILFIINNPIYDHLEMSKDDLDFLVMGTVNATVSEPVILKDVAA